MTAEPGASSDRSGATDGTITWRQLHAEAVARLRRAGIDDPEVSGRRIVEECSGFEGPEFALGLDEHATQRGVSAFDARLARRERGEPLQYVLGRWGFRTLDLFVDRRVLIPRPETEMVAELALTEVERQAGAASPLTVVDLGTGSGAIGLSIAVEARGTEVWLTDDSADALAVARANLAGLGTAGGSVRIAQGSWFDAMPHDLAGTLAVVVANPPYVSPDDELPAVVADWEPRSALVAADAGLADLRAILRAAPHWLRSDGALVLEMAPDQTEVIAEEASMLFVEVEVAEDLAGRPRAVVARRRS